MVLVVLGIVEVVVHPGPEFNSDLVVVEPCKHLFQKLLQPQSPVQSFPQVIDEHEGPPIPIWCLLSIPYEEIIRLEKIIILFKFI